MMRKVVKTKSLLGCVNILSKVWANVIYIPRLRRGVFQSFSRRRENLIETDKGKNASSD